MKTLLKYLILPVVVLVFVFYYTKEKPDIRYVLSDRIPVELVEGSSLKSVQQLEVKNVGSSEAKQIQVIMTGKIISYDLQKYSKADTVNEYRSGASAEILYPALPPQGSFKLLIRSSGDGISKEGLSVRYSQGKGKEAFGESNSYGFLWGIGFPLIYILFLVWIIWSMAADSLEGRAGYDGLSIVRRKKPFYLTATRWKTIRNKALEQKTGSFGSRDIESSPSYVFLNNDKPKGLADEDWLSSAKKASDTLTIILSDASMLPYDGKQVLNLLKVQRPLYFDEEKWAQLTMKISGIAVVLLKKDYGIRRNKEGLVSAIKQKRPDQLSEKTWSDYIEFLEQEYFNILSKEMERESLYGNSPINYLEGQQLSCIAQERADSLRERAYKLQLSQALNVLETEGAKKFVNSGKPKWMNESDYDLRLEKANRIIELDVLARKYQSLLSVIEGILSMKPLGADKPETLTGEEWGKILRIDAEFKTYMQDKENLAADRNSVSIMKSKIECQLKIIHDVLTDPGSIDRVEDYSNAFSLGNFENLKLLAKHLGAIL